MWVWALLFAVALVDPIKEFLKTGERPGIEQQKGTPNRAHSPADAPKEGKASKQSRPSGSASQQSTNPPPTTDATFPFLAKWAFQHSRLSVPVVATFALLTLWAWRGSTKTARSAEFTLAKPIKTMTPEDLGFQRFRPGQTVKPGEHRPFFEGVYILRQAFHRNGEGVRYSEDDVRQKLRAGETVLIIGRPLEGKTRYAYEVLTGMKGFWVVAMNRHAATSDDAFRLLRHKYVVLMIDDLDRFRAQDPWSFKQKVARYAKVCAVIATCRSGPELASLQAAPNLKSFLERTHCQLALVPASITDRERLASEIGKDITSDEIKRAPNLGYIVTEDAIRVMQLRAATLPDDEKDVLRALKFLSESGVRPFTYERVRVVLEKVQLRNEPSEGWKVWLTHRLQHLEENAFLLSGSGNRQLQPESAYLEYAVPSEAPESGDGAMIRLLMGLKEIGDGPGVFDLGIRFALAGKYDVSAQCFDEAVKLGLDHALVWSALGSSLVYLGRYAEALAAHERALALSPDSSYSWDGKGGALDHMGRFEEALQAHQRAVELDPHNQVAWYNMSVTLLYNLNRPDDALSACEEAISLAPEDEDSWGVKGGALYKLHRYQDALNAYLHAFKLHPNASYAAAGQSLALRSLGRQNEALEAINIAIGLDPKNRGLWIEKGFILKALGRRDEAEEALIAAEALIHPKDHDA